MKDERSKRWARRKARKDGNHSKRGCVGGNVRYGKGGNGGWPDDRPHRNRLGAYQIPALPGVY